jgi:hypothetical protein
MAALIREVGGQVCYLDSFPSCYITKLLYVRIKADRRKTDGKSYPPPSPQLAKTDSEREAGRQIVRHCQSLICTGMK